MALGSGLFTKGDKCLPGAYVRLLNVSTTAPISTYNGAFLGFGILGSLMLM